MPLPEPESEPTRSPGLVRGVARRWLWIAFATAVGVGLGYLYYTQQPAVYESSAEVLVVKTAPGTDAKAAPTEDFAASQANLIASDKILRAAAARLNPAEFQTPPPAAIEERVAFLKASLTVTRAREPSTQAPSNVLTLTFRGPDAADTPKYLDAVVQAYQAELGTLYDETPSRPGAMPLDAEKLKAEQAKLEAERDGLQKQLQGTEVVGLGPDEMTELRSRIAGNKAKRAEQNRKLGRLKEDLDVIAAVAGKDRPARVEAMLKLGVRPDRTAAPTDTSPDEALTALELQKRELATRFGPDHPEMILHQAKIDAAKERVKARKDERPMADELTRHEATLRNELEVIEGEVKRLDTAIAGDEKARELAEAKGKLDRVERRLAELGKELEGGQPGAGPAPTRTNAGYKAEAVTPPAAGKPVSSLLYQSLIVGGLLGLLVGGGTAAAAELTDRGFRTPAEVRQRLGVPVLGHLPKLRTDLPPVRPMATGYDSLLATVHRPSSADAEAFRGIRNRLLAATGGHSHQVIEVTSPSPEDGKSVLAANLAVSLAQAGRRVVLADCDLRKPRLTALFRLTGADLGVTSVIAGTSTLEGVLRPSEVPNLFLLQSGPRPGAPSQVLTSPKFTELLAELRDQFDYVIVDTPPVLTAADATALAPRADGVVLVFRVTKDSRPAEQTREQLARSGARVLGVVVNTGATGDDTYERYEFRADPPAPDMYAADDEPFSVPRKG